MDLGAQPEMLLFLLQGAFANMWTYKTENTAQIKSGEFRNATVSEIFRPFFRNGYCLVIPKRISFRKKDQDRKLVRGRRGENISETVQFRKF